MAIEREISKTRKIFDTILEKGVKIGVSDIHIRGDAPLYFRYKGKLQQDKKLNEQGILFDREGIETLLEKNLLVSKPHLWKEFITNGEVDFAYELPDLARFRINAYRQRGNVSMAIRIVPMEIPNIETLGLPSIFKDQAKKNNGLFLVTGATGNGKSTSLAALIKEINENYNKHIITIEDPIEFYFKNEKSLIDQREVNVDTNNFSNALSKVLRQDPDVIVIGEIRDRESMEVALSAAGTGHLVLSTLHTIGTSESFDRILSFFPDSDKQYIRSLLADSLIGILSQRLIKSKNDNMIPATEVLIVNDRARNKIEEGVGGDELLEIVKEGNHYDMHTFDNCLLRLVKEDKITVDVAQKYASNPDDLGLEVENNNLTGSYDTVLQKKKTNLNH